MKLKTEILQQPEGLSIVIENENLDAGNAKAFKDQMQPFLEKNNLVVLDMSALKFVDSSGLGALLACLRAMNNKGGQFKLIGLTKPVRALFELVRMHRIFPIYNSLDEAVASV